MMLLLLMMIILLILKVTVDAGDGRRDGVHHRIIVEATAAVDQLVHLLLGEVILAEAAPNAAAFESGRAKAVLFGVAVTAAAIVQWQLLHRLSLAQVHRQVDDDEDGQTEEAADEVEPHQNERVRLDVLPHQRGRQSGGQTAGEDEDRADAIGDADLVLEEGVDGGVDGAEADAEDGIAHPEHLHAGVGVEGEDDGAQQHQGVVGVENGLRTEHHRQWNGQAATDGEGERRRGGHHRRGGGADLQFGVDDEGGQKLEVHLLHADEEGEEHGAHGDQPDGEAGRRLALVLHKLS